MKKYQCWHCPFYSRTFEVVEDKQVEKMTDDGGLEIAASLKWKPFDWCRFSGRFVALAGIDYCPSGFAIDKETVDELWGDGQ